MTQVITKNGIMQLAESSLIEHTRFYSSSTDNTIGNFQTKTVNTVGSYRFNFEIPKQFGTLVSAHLVCFPSAGAAQAARDIDISVQVTQPGQAYNNFEASDTASTYDLSGRTLIATNIEFGPLLSPGAVPHAMGGVLVTHNTIGGAIDYMGIDIHYYPKTP